jgi:tetratricopeptide (TPR) repeat protein
MPDEKDRDQPLPFTVPFVAPRPQIRSHEAFAYQLARERSEAVGIVARLLRETPRENLPTLADHPELRTFGAHERLISTASTELTRDPQYALVLAQLAVSLSERLPIDGYHDVTRAQAGAYAWKEVGKTLSFLGRQEEAVQAFETAQAEIEDHGILAHDRAIIRLNLAITYQEMGRYDEVGPILVECKEVFRDHGDTRMFILAGLYEGHLLQRLRLYRKAREVYLLLLTSNGQIETDHLAALHNAIGFCSIELEDYDDAESHLTNAVRLHEQLRQPLEAAKGELGLGRLLIHRGFHDRGVDHLREIRHRFLRHSLPEEAGLCGLDMVQGMLLAGEPEPAERLARTIANEFLVAGLSSRAVTALGYLSEAIATRKASAEMAAEVREYVLSLRTTPEREFPPLLHS